MCVPAPTKVSIKRTPTEKRADSKFIDAFLKTDNIEENILIYTLVGVKTPLPTQPGMVDNCDTFCYVQKDNTCDQIANSNHITTNQFTQWNKGAGPDCLSLWAYTYVCVGVMKS